MTKQILGLFALAFVLGGCSSSKPSDTSATASSAPAAATDALHATQVGSALPSCDGLSNRSFKASPGRYLGWKTVSFKGNSVSSTEIDLAPYKWAKPVKTAPLTGTWTCTFAHPGDDFAGVTYEIATNLGDMKIDVPTDHSVNASFQWTIHGGGLPSETLIQS